MKSALICLATWVVVARAVIVTTTITVEPTYTTTTQLAFTFQSLKDHAIAAASTTYCPNITVIGCPCAAHPTPKNLTSYSVKASDLAYPSFSNVTGSVASSAPAPGLLNATALAAEAVALIFQLKSSSPKNCQACKKSLADVAARMKVQQETLSDIANPFCAALQQFIPTPVCIGLLKVASTDVGGIFPAVDMLGDDGQLLCAFMFGSCDLPAPPPLDLKKIFKGTKKPAPRALAPCTKEPLKVLHISDYHLDLRHVVGSEANCSGPSPVCCRVYPYTNVSAPIQKPASLFGDYLCDTPEALGTSVFRAVPNVTGHRWCDFSFGIFTGDLVSHDIWELTPEYVLAEELRSYQNFFDGMGGVPMYPTLGYVALGKLTFGFYVTKNAPRNHDTFPHAFTSFPGLNDVLPSNASYAVQQEYNYKNVSAAWENYGWLSSSEAQQVVTSGLGIYRAITSEGLVIISLNSDVWYYFNLYAYIGANKVDTTGMFGTLIEYLLEAESKNQAVWLIQHVNTGGSTDYEALPAATDLYYQIIDRFNNTIRATFFGHTHFDEFGIFYANNATNQTANTAASVAYIGPSVTSYTNLNAGFRYYLVDPDTFDVIDSVNYYANVSNAKAWEQAGDVHWEFEYSARSTYDPSGTLIPANYPLSAAFWHHVSEEISTNETTFKTYTDLRTKKFRPFAPISGRERNVTLCGLRSMSVPVYERCLKSMASITSFL